MRKQLCQRETQMLVAPWAPVCKGSLAFAVMWLVLLAASPGRGDVIEYTPLSLTNIVFTTHTSYGSATNEVYWPAQNHEQVHDQTQAEAEAAVVTGTESGRVERSVTHTWSRSFGGLNRRYFADHLREDQELEFNLSHLSDSDEAYRAVFEWPMKYDDGVNDINWLDTGAANVVFVQTVPVGQDTTDLDPITLEPTWTEYNSGTYFAGYGAREPTLVLESLTEEIPPCSVVPDRWWVSLGNPVNAITGNKSLERLDVSLPVPGLPLYLKREYHSLTPAGWTHNYQMSVTNKTSVFDGETNSWKVLHAGPVSMHFKDIGSGLYESPFGTRHELNVLTNGDTVVTFGSGQTARFASDGLVRELSDPFSNVLTVSYTNDATAGDVVSRVEHDNGLGLDFSYSSGRLSRVDLPSTNLYVTFTYNASGQVASVSRHFPDATYTESYGYEPSVDGAGHNLVRFTNGVGHVSHYEYQTNSAGQATSMATGSYVGSNRYLEVSVEYPTNGVASRTVTLARDGEELQYEYVYHPGLGVLEAIIGPTGADDLRRRETRFEFDESGDRTAMVVGDWEISEWTRTEFAYNSQHQVTNIAHGYMTDSPTNAWIYTWHPNLDEISSITDPDERVIEIDYTNGLISASRLVVDASNSYETAYSYTTNGLLASVTNANGHYIGYAYDSYGYLKEIDPQVGPTITLSNNVLGHLVKIELPGWGGTTTPGGSADPRVIELEPDGLGRVVRITYPDDLEEEFAYDAVGNLVTNVDRAGRASVYTYEPLGRLASATRYLVGDSSTQDVTIAFGYDQQFNTLEVTDPLGRDVEAYQLDELGRADSITNVDSRVMSVEYGVEEYVNSITRFDDSEAVFLYGQNGLLDSAIYDDETLEFEYYDNDLLKVAENSEASITDSYNSVNRLTNVVIVSGAVTSEVSYTYFPAGQVSNMTTEAGTVTFSYDAAERITDIVDSVAGSFEYSYNTNNGLVQDVEYPNDVECSLDYDVMDRLTAISWTGPSGTLHSLSYQYDAAGMITNRVEESLAGTRNSAFTYDSLDRLTGETYSDGSGTVFDEVGYEYDLAGNRTNKTHNGVTVSFELGAGNRMTNWTAQVSTNAEAVMYVAGYSSEDIGTDPRYGEWTVNQEDAEMLGTNFWSITVFSDLSQTSHTVIAAIGDEAGNVGRDTNTWTLTIITNAAYSFDDAGNVTEIAYNSNLMVRTLGWDSQYQLTAVSNGSTEVESYSYDPFGRRLTTSEGTNTITHLYDGIHCVADVDSSGGLVRSYAYGPGVDNPLAMTVYGAETNTYYYLTDHLGSVLALTDEDGQLVEYYEYDAFGRIRVFDEGFEEIAESAYGNRVTFQGREYSWATGLYYFRARWYEPVTGRWLSRDPIGISGGLNQYVAFGNSPTTSRDPYGLTNLPGDFGWSMYSFDVPRDFSAPQLGVYRYSRGQLDSIVRRTYERLHTPPPVDQGILDSDGPNALQRTFDTEFFYRKWINIEGDFCRGDEINYFAQGMFDEHYENIPYWRMFAWKFWMYNEFPPSAPTIDWYDYGRSEYDRFDGGK